jgi:adenine-specific DNA-methyltransferase
VTGTLPSGESCLALWRDCDVLDNEGISKLCDRLTQTAEEGGATRMLKLRQIEPVFLERMFSVEDSAGGARR